ncbi:hypothetical protein ElyMa_001744400 [Elysia marginata]|uniref:Uncharacterized protein n=1 Tax=Elysia marginata TaxID=1093978 RepID=A0AAV4E9A3_9GAST|nr:hypothetical protein ElyMa_001744400 [Elysia marginata]
MLMGARPVASRQTDLNHQDPRPTSTTHGPLAPRGQQGRERSKEGESDRVIEAQLEEGQKTNEEGKCRGSEEASGSGSKAAVSTGTSSEVVAISGVCWVGEIPPASSPEPSCSSNANDSSIRLKIGGIYDLRRFGCDGA